MSSIKLTNATRGKLLERLLAGRFDERYEALYKRWAKLAEMCYNRQYSKAARDTMEQLPEGWLPECGSIAVQFGPSGDRYIQLNFHGRGHFQEDKIRKRFPNADKAACRLALDLEDSLTKQFEGLKSAKDDLDRECKELKHEVQGVLYSFNTTGELAKRWPEIAHLIADLQPVTTPTVPAPLLTALNAKLGLKKAA